MADPNRILIENIVIALIKTQSPFTNASAAPVVNYDKAEDLKNTPDYVHVNCGTPVPLIPARTPALPALVQQAPVVVTAHVTTNNLTKINDWEYALNTVLLTTTNAINTVANNSFPNGFQIDQVTQGTRQSEGSESRERSLEFRVVFRP